MVKFNILSLNYPQGASRNLIVSLTFSTTLLVLGVYGIVVLFLYIWSSIIIFLKCHCVFAFITYIIIIVKVVIQVSFKLFTVGANTYTMSLDFTYNKLKYD